MKYRNIVFDFGNVIGKFDGNYILQQICKTDKDVRILAPIVYKNWPDLDKGTLDYDSYALSCEEQVPEPLRETVRRFFHEWPRHLQLLQPTLDLICRLKQQGFSIYLLSNAPTYFVEYASAFDFLKEFDGIVFSAPIKMAKPSPEIYQYLFDMFNLKAEECFFIDDLKENIESAKKLGMEGIVFTGDIEPVIKSLEL